MKETMANNYQNYNCIIKIKIHTKVLKLPFLCIANVIYNLCKKQKRLTFPNAL